MRRDIDPDSACDQCHATPQQRTCADCGVSGWVTDCGHMGQPRPIAAGRVDGAESHKDFCENCALHEEADASQAWDVWVGQQTPAEFVACCSPQELENLEETLDNYIEHMESCGGYLRRSCSAGERSQLLRELRNVLPETS